jgi:50S ribosomal protein L16 3-hydroxylase
MLEVLRWSERDVASFMGVYLTEPKRNVVFARPSSRDAPARFSARIETRGLRLALPTRMLVAGADVFINGEANRATPAGRRLFAMLADARELARAMRIDEATRRLLYEWYRAGYIEVGAESTE